MGYQKDMYVDIGYAGGTVGLVKGGEDLGELGCLP